MAKTKRKTTKTATAPTKVQKSGLSSDIILLLIVAIVVGVFAWVMLLNNNYRQAVADLENQAQQAVDNLNNEGTGSDLSGGQDSDTTLSKTSMVGEYKTELPPPEVAGDVISIILFESGDVHFMQSYQHSSNSKIPLNLIDEIPPIIMYGSWEIDSATQIVTATFTEPEDIYTDLPKTMRFTYTPGQLVLIDYVDEWGNADYNLYKEPTVFDYLNTLESADYDANGSSGLVANQWQWQSTTLADGGVITPTKADAFTLVFDLVGGLSITTDCNNGRTTYELDETMLTLKPIASTMKFCFESQESIFNSQLASVSTYALRDEQTLILTLNDGGVMTFIAI